MIKGKTMQKILVTGGAGYIGSHTLIELIKAGFVPVVYDNLSNSSPQALERVEQITDQEITFIKGDVLDTNLLDKVFGEHEFFAVIHFAGKKAVGESVAKPVMYYQNNVSGTLNVLEAMKKHAVTNFIFSSSATVYGEPECLPLTETAKRSATNPYGHSKLMVEYILEDLAKADDKMSLVSLRYFNPIGAHESGLIGEDPSDIPNNLMPYISQVAVGKLSRLSVFGDDYDTVDGTGVRDYIHVVDLARGHVAAVQYLAAQACMDGAGFLPVNLGTGNGTSVLELVNAFIETTGQAVPYVITDRRAGDVAACYASSDKAKALFGWQAQFDIHQMCIDTWRWQKGNPNGYHS